MKALSILLVCAATGGCLVALGPGGGPAPYPEKTGEGKGPTLWLNFSLMNEGDQGRFADLGPHCGTARSSTEWVRNEDGGWSAHNTYQAVFVEEAAYAKLGAKRPFLVVTHVAPPSGGHGFVTMGSEGFPAAFPFTLDPKIRNGTQGSSHTPTTTIDQRDGVTYVDGEPVSLPHKWNAAKPGDWSARFELSQGPVQVSLFRIENCA